MDVRLAPEQAALRDIAAEVVDRLGVRAVGELDDDERRAKLDAAVASSGWRELRVGGDDGAPLASGVEVAIVAEELGRGLADVAFLGPVLASDLLRRAEVAPEDRLESVVLDSALAGLLVMAGDKPSGALAVDAQGIEAALLLVSAPDGHVLARATAAVTRQGTDLTRPTATIARDAPIQRFDGELLSADDITAWTALGLVITCADLVGIMRGATRLSCDYAIDRKQFGVAIGSFQAVQHLLADAFVATEGAASVTRHAAWAVDALEPADALAAAATAKAYCARAAAAVCETAIQVHGGIGNTWECLAHVYLRRALMSIDILGGEGPNLTRVLRQYGIDHRQPRGDDGLR